MGLISHERLVDLLLDSILEQVEVKSLRDEVSGIGEGSMRIG